MGRHAQNRVSQELTVKSVGNELKADGSANFNSEDHTGTLNADGFFVADGDTDPFELSQGELAYSAFFHLQCA